METKGLSANDLCRIIGKCSEAGVEVLKLADIEIKFRSKRNESVPLQSHEEAGMKEILPIIEPIPITEEAVQVIREMEDKALDDAFEAQAMVDDPLAFESGIIARDIERQRELNG